jgi:hypothetical protein
MECDLCKQIYYKGWIKNDKCFFCNKYLSLNTNDSVFFDVEWQYYWSGENNMADYYAKYVKYLTKWLTFWEIDTNSDYKIQEDLDKITSFVITNETT